MKDKNKDSKMPDAETVVEKRRAFLKQATLSTAAIGAAAVVGQVEAEELVEIPADSVKGYQQSEHVQRYYKLARF